MMIARENKQIVDDTKREKQRKLRAFDQLVDYMDAQHQHRAILLIRARRSAIAGAGDSRHENV